MDPYLEPDLNALPLPSQGAPDTEYDLNALPLPHQGAPDTVYDMSALPVSHQGGPDTDYEPSALPSPSLGGPDTAYDLSALPSPSQGAPDLIALPSLHQGELNLSALPSPDTECGPDLECAVCFSQFNNVFRTPKILQCRHTFCLECLARMNVKSSQPDSIQCPLCRSLTPLPPLGLPRLATNRTVLSYLPLAMQRVYSIRFNRRKGRLQVKRTSEPCPNLATLRTISQSLDVGLPNSLGGGHSTRGGGRRMGVLLRLSGRPMCRVFLLTAVVVMMILLTGIIIFLLTYTAD